MDENNKEEYYKCGILEAIEAMKSEKYLEIISVIDARNGKVLFENEKFENEFSKVLKDFFEKYKIHELIEKGKELI